MSEVPKPKIVDKTDNIQLRMDFYQMMNLTTDGESDIIADLFYDEDEVSSESYGIIRMAVARYIVNKNISLIGVKYSSPTSLFIEVLPMYPRDDVLSFIANFIKDFNNFDENYKLFSGIAWDHDEYYEGAKLILNRFYKAVFEEGHWIYSYEDFEVGDYSYRYEEDD